MAKYQGAARGQTSDLRKASVEGAEFPILCETCLGPNPYVRMLKEAYGRECKVCGRPFAVFRWKAGGAGARYKKTEVCQTCARLKNVCQTCLLDLKYGLPVQVRDRSLAPADRQALVVPQSEANREYFAAQADRKVASGEIDKIYQAEPQNSIARRLARGGKPKYERNRARICSFFVKGECKRGFYCPYRHEMPHDKDSPFAKQNLKDRYYGVNDPVAEAMLAGVRKESRGKDSRARRVVEPPADQSITTIFVGGLKADALVQESHLVAKFSPYGTIKGVRIIRDKGIAFVEMDTRKQAESAMNELYGALEIDGRRYNVSWAKASGRKSGDSQKSEIPVGLHSVQHYAQGQPYPMYYGPMYQHQQSTEVPEQHLDEGPAKKKPRMDEGTALGGDGPSGIVEKDGDAEPEGQLDEQNPPKPIIPSDNVKKVNSSDVERSEIKRGQSAEQSTLHEAQKEDKVTARESTGKGGGNPVASDETRNVLRTENQTKPGEKAVPIESSDGADRLSIADHQAKKDLG